MRNFLQLAGFLLLTAPATTHAQITSPDILVAPAPRPPQTRSRAPEDNLQWLWSFTQDPDSQRALELRDDPRFKEMLSHNFRAPQSFWGENLPLSQTISLFLTRYGHITSQDNRYITIDGCVPRFCPAHGLLWIDLGTPHPLIVFIAVNWSTTGHTVSESTAAYNLWLFSNRPLTQAALPDALVKSVAAWDQYLKDNGRIVPHIGHAILVAPTGMPTLIMPELLGANRLPPHAALNPADGAPDEPNP